MSKQLWACDKCGSTYKQQSEAEACEKAHRDPGGFQIVGVTYRRTTDLDHSEGREQARLVPQELVVRFSDDWGDLASYKLDHYGLRGL